MSKIDKAITVVIKQTKHELYNIRFSCCDDEIKIVMTGKRSKIKQWYCKY